MIDHDKRAAAARRRGEASGDDQRQRPEGEFTSGEAEARSGTHRVAALARSSVMKSPRFTRERSRSGLSILAEMPGGSLLA